MVGMPNEQVNEVENAARGHQRGSSAQSAAPAEQTEKMRIVNVRLPEDMLAEVDGLRQQRRVKVSRNTWFLEAIVEKTQREKG